MRKSMFTIIVMTTLMCGNLFVGNSLAADKDVIEDLKRNKDELRQRIKKLETALNEIKRLLAERPTAPAPTIDEGEKPAVRSKFKTELYGYIKLDASYDTARTYAGNYAAWVESEATNKNDDQFNMTANQTRLGLNFYGPDFGNGKTSGKIEIDFYGGEAENKPHLRMRHAYLKLDWPENDFSILAGQTWDVIAPVNPTTLNFLGQLYAGNMGHRRPQLRLSKGFNVGESSKLLLQGALARTIGHDTAFDPGDTGEDAGFPTTQARVAFSFPLFTDNPTTIGVSGHWGQEEYDIDNAGNKKDLDSWSGILDLTLPLMDKLTLKGELWTGENLDTYCGGIGQGVNSTTIEEIESTGGWAALSFGSYDKWGFNLGGGIDNPDDNDLNNGDRSQNFSFFGNVLYTLNEAVQFGLELSRWETKYKNQADGDSERIQSSITYKF